MSRPSFSFPILPSHVPQFPVSITQKICRVILRLSGWRIVGEFPDVSKLVLIAAPHSSNWDAIWGLLFKLSLGLNIKFLVKSEAFFWPLGAILRKVGGIPADRTAAHGVVGQMKTQFIKHERFWLLIAPEGTRKRVNKWKSGFWYIAHNLKVPVLLIYFHYPEKVIGIGPLIETSVNLNIDMQRIREFYRPWQGKRHGT